MLLTTVYCNEKKVTEISQGKMINTLNGVFESVIGPMINPSDPKKSYVKIFPTLQKGLHLLLRTFLILWFSLEGPKLYQNYFVS